MIPLLRWQLVVLVALVLRGDRLARAQPPDQPSIVVGETQWGFDGKAMRESFTPLSILVQNPGPRPASGVLKLTRAMAVAQEPPVEIPFDIPPFDDRWVQATIWTLDDTAFWKLTWGTKPGEELELSQPRTGGRAAVLLTNPNDRPRPSGALRRFRANLFPVSVTATDGLEAVFLDSAPELQGARLQAFLEWLQRGGTVVLLHGDNAAYPRFPSALAALNEPSDVFRVGAGVVRRIAAEPQAISQEEISRAVKSERPVTSRETAAAFSDPYRTYSGKRPWNHHRGVLEKLENVSRFQRRWWLIYPLALLYLLALFPGCFAVSRSQNGVRWFYVAFAATAVLFSLAFKVLGGVGGGSTNRVRSATIAHQLAPGVYDCTQWSSLAAVNGGWYRLSHDGSGRLYGHCEEYEVPHGLITAGSEARYDIDIPVGSTRTAVSRFRATAPAADVKLISTDLSDGKLVACALSLEGLPGKPLEVFTAHRDWLLRLQNSGDAWSADRRRGMNTSVFISNLQADLRRIPTFGFVPPPERDQLLTEEFWRSLDRSLVGNAFQIRQAVEPWSAVMPEGLLRVMALVEADAAFAPQIDQFPDSRGVVLYVIDRPLQAR